MTGYAVAEMTRAARDEAALIAALKDGDEAVFADLVDRHTPSMLRVARGYVRRHEVAEEVVQEAWIALLKGIGKFEGRSSLRTWLFTILINIAKTRGIRDRRDSEVEILAFTGGTVDPARFRPADDQYPGHWRQDEVPAPFPDTPLAEVADWAASARFETLEIACWPKSSGPSRRYAGTSHIDVAGLSTAEGRDIVAMLGGKGLSISALGYYPNPLHPRCRPP